MDRQDEIWMARALDLAEKGRGYVEPNPLVGAVIVREDHVVGEGWHERFGEAHAEVNALGLAGESARGATLYVTLEPCCHQGKTPPCTEAIIRAGIGRVLAAMTDPFPQVAGHGTERLRQAGIAVETGLEEKEAKQLNAPYLKLLRTGRPYVHAKWAMTLDGKIATRSGDSRWITGDVARGRVHELRGRMDAIIVGIGTVLADDPRLSVRPPGPRVPTRIILDSRGRLPKNCNLVKTLSEAPLLVVTASCVPESHGPGYPTLHLAAGGDGRPDVLALLDELGQRKMTNVLVEGGAAVLGSFFDAKTVDEVHVFIAPRIGGGREMTAVAGRGVEKIADALALVEWNIEQLGPDIFVHGFVSRP